MVYHIVMWKFKEEVEEEKKPALKAAMKEALEGLVGVVPGLRSLRLIDQVVPSSTHDMALVSTLDCVEDIAQYGKHPAHVEAADTYVRPFVTERACLDYEE